MESKPVDIGMARLNPEEADEQRPGDQLSEKSAATASPATEMKLSAEQIEEVRNKIVEKLLTCFDPEIPVNIYELGLIYDIAIQPDGSVRIPMTLTTPACPAAGYLPGEVEQKVRQVPHVNSVDVELVWDPPWDNSRMSEAAKLQLGIED